jgi:hypothetical protein
VCWRATSLRVIDVHCYPTMTGDILACPAINPFLTMVWRRPLRSDILSGVSFARRPKPTAFGQRSGLGRVQVLIHDHHRGLEKRGDEVAYRCARRARCERNRRPPGPSRIRATCTPLRNHEAATWMGGLLCARAHGVRWPHDGTAHPCSLSRRVVGPSSR